MQGENEEMNQVLTCPLCLPVVAELCVLYGQNEEGMVGELIAFCTSTGKAHLTPEILNTFEHEVRTQCRKTAMSFCSIGEVCEVSLRVWSPESDLDSSPTVSLGKLLNISEP